MSGLNIGLIDVDGHNFPNLALMKISAWHKAQGDAVSLGIGVQRKLKSGKLIFDGLRGDYIPAAQYDVVYVSKVFDRTYSADLSFTPRADRVEYQGTGYTLKGTLPAEIEHACPDYSLYGEKSAYGFLTRGCPRGCKFCIVAEKEGRKSVQVAEVSEWWNGQKEIKLLDPNTLACRDHMKLLKQLSHTGAWVDFTQGVDARMLTDENILALNAVKTKMIHFAWDLMPQSEAVLKGLSIYKPHRKLDERLTRVYVLVNFDTTMEENLYRIYHLRELGFDPYVMIYDKPHAKKEIKDLQRWVNNKRIWRSCERFEDYRA